VPFKKKGFKGLKINVSNSVSALGSCAHVKELHRFQQGPFMEQDMLDSNEWTMENILVAIQKAKETHGAFLKRSRRNHKYEASLLR
jgi:tRNA U55 pseudouridine synthase TruB